ncbi:metal ABC transporter permease [Marinithermofilum abyssi]|uniref:Metal ABC transporter permease n=2 Tax=Marinithermofilum abyssi TaxID=1571185 RepID=A0A8J2VBJ5_9BACL|nr:metal ABC transporter permease [Marinithermofilum abyssi]
MDAVYGRYLLVMLEMILHYEIMQRAVLAGMIIGVIAPLIGVFLVVRRLSLIADALSHVTLSGVAAGLLLQKYFSFFQSVNPIYVGMAFSMIGSFFVEQLRRLYRSYQELAIPVILSGGIGLGVVLISAANGFNVDVAGYLFGSILAVGKSEIWSIAAAGMVVAAVVFFFYKELFALSFDEESAALSGIPRRWINGLFIVSVALVITASIRVVGILLVSGLITLPVAASLQIAKSFRQALWLSVLFAQIAVLSGLAAAFYLDWASGGTIILVSVAILLSVLAIKEGSRRIRRFFANRPAHKEG